MRHLNSKTAERYAEHRHRFSKPVAARNELTLWAAWSSVGFIVGSNILKDPGFASTREQCCEETICELDALLSQCRCFSCSAFRRH
jgi:hypothetical protein